MTSDEKHPIAAGLAALIGVGLAVGLLLGVLTLVVSRVAGLGGHDSATTAATGPSLYLPSPRATPSSAGGQADLPAASTPSTGAAEPTRRPHKKAITLRTGQGAVSPGERIDLSGVYSGGGGAVLQVQRKDVGGAWQDFPVTVTVSGGTFSTYVQTSRPGKQVFRVRDSGAGKASNSVVVTVR